MCFDAQQPRDNAAISARQENGDAQKEHDPQRPWTNRSPRGHNPTPDRRDVERNIERLASLVGR